MEKDEHLGFLNKMLPKLGSRAVFVKCYYVCDHMGVILNSIFCTGRSGVRINKFSGDAAAASPET